MGGGRDFPTALARVKSLLKGKQEPLGRHVLCDAVFVWVSSQQSEGRVIVVADFKACGLHSFVGAKVTCCEILSVFPWHARDVTSQGASFNVWDCGPIAHPGCLCARTLVPV